MVRRRLPSARVSLGPGLSAWLLAALLATAGCGDDARTRYDAAVFDHDPVEARSAALARLDELSDTPEAVIEVARLLGDIGEMNEARWLLSEAVARHPESSELRLGLAETSLRIGDAENALAALGEPETGTDAVAYAEVLRARAHVELGDLAEGLAILERAHRQFEEPTLFRLERVDLLAGAQRHEQALETVREMEVDPAVSAEVREWLATRASDLVLAIDGPEAALERLGSLDSHTAVSRRAALLVMLGRRDEALEEIRTAIEREPDAGALYPVGAQVSLAAGDIANAEALLREHLAAEPGATSLRNLALFLSRLGRGEEASEMLAKLPEIEDPVDRIELRYLAIVLQMEAGDLDRARSAIDAFARDHPRNPRLGYLLARRDLADGKPEAAAARLMDVLTRLDRSDVKHLLGVALERSGDYAGAEVRYGLAAQQSPHQIPSWLGLLRTLQAQGKWERVAAVAEQMIRVAPVGASGFLALANARIAMGQPAEAEGLLRDSLEQNPGLVGPRVGLSVALRRQGRAAEALEVLEFDSPNELIPAEQGELAAERAVVLGQLGRWAEAFAVLEGAPPSVESDVDGRSLRHARIYLLFAAGRVDEALLEAERASTLDPDDPTPSQMAADHLASRGRFAESVVPYREALARAADADVAFRLAVSLERSERDPEAIEAYRRAVAIDERAVGPRNNLALVLARTGALREALEAAQGAYARAESDPLVMDTLATLYLEWGLAPRATRLLEKALHAAESVESTEAGGSSDRMVTDTSEIAYHLALAYRESNRLDDARALLAELDAKLEPGHALRASVDTARASVQ